MWTYCCSLCVWSSLRGVGCTVYCEIASEQPAAELCRVWWWQWTRLPGAAGIIPCSGERRQGVMSMFLQRLSQLAGPLTHLWQTARPAAATLLLPPTGSQSGSTGGEASEQRSWSAGWRRTGGRHCLPATGGPQDGPPCACSPWRRPHLEKAVVITTSRKISCMIASSQWLTQLHYVPTNMNKVLWSV